MVALTPTKVNIGVDQSVVYVFDGVNTGDTFNVGAGKLNILCTMVGAPGTQTDAGMAVGYSAGSGSLTFRPGVDGLSCFLRVYPR